MSNLEKAAAYIGIAAFLVGIGISWNALNNRIDRLDEKIESIQKTLGSTTCNAILTRPIEAIEKGRAEARKALEGLSRQYDCVPRRQDGLPIDLGMGDTMMSASETNLSAQLNAVDVLLNEGR